MRYSCASLTGPCHEDILRGVPRGHNTETISLNTALNKILAWGTLFGLPVEEEALKVQDKSYDISCFCFSNHSPFFTSDRAELILDRLSKAVLRAINRTPTMNQQMFFRAILSDLVELETTPECLMKVTCRWCSEIYKNRESLRDWEGLLLLCLEIGFRRLDSRHEHKTFAINHTEHQRGLIDVVFRGGEIEVIADLLLAWTTRTKSRSSAVELLGLRVRHLIGLQNQVPSSPRLRWLVIRSAELTEYAIPNEVGMDRFIEFLNHLHVTTKDVDNGLSWVVVLVRTIQSPGALQHLSHSYWKLLVELAVSAYILEISLVDGLRITTTLIEAEEWSKLECWMGAFWMLLSKDADLTEGV